MKRRRRLKRRRVRKQVAPATRSTDQLLRIIERHHGVLVDIIHAHANPYRGVTCLGWRPATDEEKASSPLLVDGWMFFIYPGQHTRVDHYTGQPVYNRMPLYVISDIIRQRIKKTP